VVHWACEWLERRWPGLHLEVRRDCVTYWVKARLIPSGFHALTVAAGPAQVWYEGPGIKLYAASPTDTIPTDLRDQDAYYRATSSRRLWLDLRDPTSLAAAEAALTQFHDSWMKGRTT